MYSFRLDRIRYINKIIFICLFLLVFNVATRKYTITYVACSILLLDSAALHPLSPWMLW